MRVHRLLQEQCPLGAQQEELGSGRQYLRREQELLPAVLTWAAAGHARGRLFRGRCVDTDYGCTLLKTFDIDKDKKFSSLSQGQQAAVNAALGLASLSKVTIFDEVTNGMDAPTRELFYSEVLAAKDREERIIILSTHIISEMEHLFDDIIMMHNGKILLHESTDELLEKGYTVAGKAERVRAFTDSKHVINVKFLGALQIDTVLGKLSYEEMDIAADDNLDISPLKLQEMFISLTNSKKEEV